MLNERFFSDVIIALLNYFDLSEEAITQYPIELDWKNIGYATINKPDEQGLVKICFTVSTDKLSFNELKLVSGLNVQWESYNLNVGYDASRYMLVLSAMMNVEKWELSNLLQMIDYLADNALQLNSILGEEENTIAPNKDGTNYDNYLRI